jgi:hypothetical protein
VRGEGRGAAWQYAAVSETSVVGAVDEVDLITQRGPDEVVLIMTQVGEWDDSDDQLLALQAKLNNYLIFVLDGGLQAQYPGLGSARWALRLDCQSEPPGRTAQFIDAARGLVRQEGGDLEVAYLSAGHARFRSPASGRGGQLAGTIIRRTTVSSEAFADSVSATHPPLGCALSVPGATGA